MFPSFICTLETALYHSLLYEQPVDHKFASISLVRSSFETEPSVSLIIAKIRKLIAWYEGEGLRNIASD